MQNYEQMRLIMDWERDHYRLGNEYKNKLAKKPVEEVKQELAGYSTARALKCRRWKNE